MSQNCGVNQESQRQNSGISSLIHSKYQHVAYANNVIYFLYSLKYPSEKGLF